MERMLNIALDYLQVYGLKILGAIVILIIGFWIAKKLTNGIVKLFHKRELDPTLSKFVSSIIKTLLYVVVIIAALNQAEIETTSLVAIIGAAGLAVGLALQGSLGNFASGVMLII